MSRFENFLNLYSSKNTVHVYKYGLTEFFKTIYGENQGTVEELAEKYLDESRDYEQDIRDFQASIRDRPPKSVNIMLVAVKGFLVENDVELSTKFWKRVRGRVKGSRAITLDKVPSTQKLRQILTHMPVQGKALFLVLASSGMRIGEALQLKEDDIEFDNDLTIVYVRAEYTKTGNPRRTLISSEAKEAIVEWLKVKLDYLNAAIRKSHLYKKNSDDPRIFPFKNNTAYMIWRKAIEKTGNGQRDKSTNRYRLHPHSLRKFFRTKLGAVIPVDIVEALMGHEGYLTEVYRRYSVEDLAKFYKKGEHALLVYTEAAEVGKLKAEIEEKSKYLQNMNYGLQNQLNQMRTENMMQKEHIKKLEDNISEINKRYDHLDNKIKVFGESLEKLLK